MSDPTISSSETESKGSSRLKKLTSSSTWTSPFRNAGGKKNIIKEFKENNSVSQLHVPKKFTSHPNLDKGETVEPVAKSEVAAAPETDLSAETKSDANLDTDAPEKEAVAAEAAVDGAPEATPDIKSVEAVKNEPLATSEADLDADSERPLTDAEKSVKLGETDAAETAKTAANSKKLPEPEPVPLVNENVGDDNIEELVKENPIELDLAPEAKYVPVEAPNQKVLDSLADKPNLLNRYQELNGAVIGQNPTTLDGPDKVIDLGSGLRLTQQQLLDIAAKRVAPVIANINEEVSKTQKEDKIVEKKELDATVAKHDAKLTKDFDKHVGKIEKVRAKFDKEIAAKLAALEKESKASTTAAEEFEKKTTQEIATANDEYFDREKKAMSQHETDKETLLKNHDELEATKKQELADSKTNQTKTTEEIETLQETKAGLDNGNSELSDEIERLTKELAEREEALTAISGKLDTEKEAFENNEETKKELNEKVAVAQKGVEDKKESKSKLAVEVGLLGTAVAAYAAKLTSLKSDNEKKPERVAAAKEKYDSWNSEKKELAGQVAREHEQKRLEAREAANTEQILAEIEEEKQRLEEEKQQYAEERARLEQEEKERQEQREKEEQERKEAEEKEAEEKRIAEEKEAEEKRLAEEQAAKEAEEKRLADEKAEKEKKEAEEKRLAEEQAAKEKKEAEEKKLAEEKAAKEKKEAEEKAAKEKQAEERKLAEEKAAKEKKQAEEKAAKEKEAEEKRLAEEKAAKAKEVDTSHHSANPETTVVGYDLSGVDGKKTAEPSVPKELSADAHKKSAEPAVAPIAAHKQEKSASTTAVPVVAESKAKSPEKTGEEAAEPEEKHNNHKTLAALGAGAGVGGLAGAALGSSSGGSSGSPNVNGNKSAEIEDPERKKSFSKKLKSVFSRKHKDDEAKSDADKTKQAALAPSSAKAANVAKQPHGKTGASSSDDLVSIYEEVSDKEFEKHRGDPDYIEVDTVQAEKLLKRHKNLLPLLEEPVV